MDYVDIVDKLIYNIIVKILQAPSRVKRLIPKEEEMKMKKRNKHLKTIKQLTKEEKNKIDLEFGRIYKLLSTIKEDEYNQLKEFEFEEIIENANKDLDRISETEEGYWAKYIVITNEYIGLKTKGNLFKCKF